MKIRSSLTTNVQFDLHKWWKTHEIAFELVNYWKDLRDHAEKSRKKKRKSSEMSEEVLSGDIARDLPV